MESSDFLVIGSGVAGLIYALDVARFGTVTVLCKERPTEGNTFYAQGGIASVTSPLDSFEAHISDTISAGAGLCHEDIVRMVIEDGPASIERLVKLGTKFDREESSFELGQEGGHSARRILHARDRTGAEILQAVYQEAANHPNIRILPNQIAIDLVTQVTSGGQIEVVGAYSLDKPSGTIKAFRSRVTMLATGGMGKVYLYTSNPDVATGDGVAMAFRAGAVVGNLEFIQFHPTCLYHPQAKSFLITEALRGEGGRLLNRQGHRFMQDYDSRAELAPRDIVARAIDDQMKKTGADFVLLDISFRDSAWIRERFPTIYQRTLELGFDMTKEPLPVVPAAHYSCGGVQCDATGRSTLSRLYVAGEAALTGLHGANRLASNSLLEAIVFAQRAAVDTGHQLENLAMPGEFPEWDSLNTVRSREEVLVSHTWDEVRRLMWNLVGIVRSDRRLRLAKRRIELIGQEIRDYYWKYLVTSDLIELRNITQLAEIIIACAANRRESRGLHFNVDCPDSDDTNWKRDSLVRARSTASGDEVEFVR